MNPDDPERAEFDRRRRARAIVTAVLLVGMVALVYFITIARIAGDAAARG